MKALFSRNGGAYQQFRPVYPPELFEFILQYVSQRRLAWDCGTGNGQSAKMLARYFEKVIATDQSPEQLRHAVSAPNIFYRQERAEQPGLEDQSVDLVTIAQALHWFCFEDFYKEVKRVCRPGAVIAAWTYSLLQIDPLIDQVLHDFHYKTLKDSWDPERHYVNEQYSTIPFPFKAIPSPAFEIRVEWSMAELEGYLSTWSAVQHYRSAWHEDPVPAVMSRVATHWGKAIKRAVIFPLHLKIGYVHERF